MRLLATGADRRNALRLRARPEVDARIKWLMSQKAAAIVDATAEAVAATATAEIRQAQVTRQWVIDRLAENAEVCLGRRAAANGRHTYNPQGATRALELLGKEVGMFQDKDPRGDKPDASQIDKHGVFTDERILRLFGLPPELAEKYASRGR